MISKITKTTLFAAGLCLAVTTSAYADKKLQEGASASMLATPCAGCHGPDGNSEGSAPSIAGMSVADMTKAMNDFKAGKGDATIMDRIAKGYNDADIKAIAEYFASKN